LDDISEIRKANQRQTSGKNAFGKIHSLFFKTRQIVKILVKAENNATFPPLSMLEKVGITRNCTIPRTKNIRTVNNRLFIEYPLKKPL
jgi:catabolite regulation protein CreA